MESAKQKLIQRPRKCNVGPAQLSLSGLCINNQFGKYKIIKQLGVITAVTH
jgi:hypothetical protein